MFKIRNFEYNGFMGQLLGGYAKYTAEFLNWTKDPGVAIFLCSDGKERLIPTFAIEGDIHLPEQNYEELGGKTIFGTPSHS